MAINFPSSPLVGDLYTFNGKTWQWDGSYWIFVSSTNTLSSATTVGGGVSIISGISNSVLYLKSFTGGVTDNGNTISISGGTSSGSTSSSFTGGTVTGATNFTGGLSANTFSATTYFNLPVSGLTEGSNIGLTNNNGNYTISFTGTTGSNFTGGTVTGTTNFTGGITATTISATTIFADNIQETLYRLPSSVALPVSTTTTAATISIPRTSVFSAQTLKVEGIFVGQQPTAANKTIQCFWNNGLNPQATTVATTSNTGSFGFLARITQGGVFFSRNAIYAASNQGSNSYSDVGGNILIRVEINPSTSAATLEHLVVTLY